VADRSAGSRERAVATATGNLTRSDLIGNGDDQIKDPTSKCDGGPDAANKDIKCSRENHGFITRCAKGRMIYLLVPMM
jgi:hypothetical protein